MTTLRDFDITRVFEVVKDLQALELTQRVIQAEVAFHESRLTQLKELDGALDQRINELRKG